MTASQPDAGQSLQAKAGLVTGAGSGIGRASALAMAREGAAVLLVGRRMEPLEVVRAEIVAHGGRAEVFAADVTLRETCAQAVERCVAAFGSFDIAFNNAGGHGQPAPIEAVDDAQEDYFLTLNLQAVYWSNKYQIARLRQQGRGGSIVNNASIFGLKGAGGIAYYTAAKFGVVGLTKAVALECAASGIRVNAIAPGGTETPNFMAIMGDAHAMDAAVPMGRIGQPHEIAEAAVWLMSSRASYVTGSVLSVDGGLAAG